ncbi:radical SAM/SPASM domain-containing protein [Desulfobacter curvatus]|uniref:radical SAM/SPASM domain-containing protein n=1 Tax=Desulfobacter curvatus TaxID=2290 RepID=UPI00037957A9|nr:radical SAM protein [Desulfobacter curvatus]
MSDEWSFSKYSITVESNKGDLLLCNSFNGALTRIKSQDSPLVLNLIDRTVSVSDLNNPLFAKLVEQGFFVSKKLDECRFVESSLQKEEFLKGVSLTVLVNQICNFRCLYCYEKLSGKELSARLVNSIIEYIQSVSKALDWLNISWYGGEPLLSKNLIIKLLCKINSITNLADISFKSSITTNGYLLDKRTAIKLITNNCRMFQVTLDGPPKIHNKNRLYIDGSRTYEVVADNILQLLNISKTFKIIIRVNFNIYSFPFILDWVSQLKKKANNDSRLEFSYHPIWNSNKTKYPKNSNDEIILTNQIVKLYSNSKEDAIRFIKRAHPNGDVCPAVKKNNFIIMPDGKVLKCEAALNNPLNQVGKLHDGGKILYDLKKLSLWEIPETTREDCLDCWYYPACRGISCNLYNLNKNVQKKVCPTGKKAIPKIIEKCF